MSEHTLISVLPIIVAVTVFVVACVMAGRQLQKEQMAFHKSK